MIITVNYQRIVPLPNINYHIIAIETERKLLSGVGSSDGDDDDDEREKNFSLKQSFPKLKLNYQRHS